MCTKNIEDCGKTKCSVKKKLMNAWDSGLDWYLHTFSFNHINLHSWMAAHPVWGVCSLRGFLDLMLGSIRFYACLVCDLCTSKKQLDLTKKKW